MSRTILRDIAIFSLIGIALFYGLFTFTGSLITEYSEYGVTPDDQYSAIYQNVTQFDEIYEKTIDTTSAAETDSGVGETSVGDELQVTASMFDAATFIVFTLPKIFFTFITQVLGVLGINAFFQKIFVSIILILIIFATISLLFRKDA